MYPGQVGPQGLSLLLRSFGWAILWPLLPAAVSTFSPSTGTEAHLEAVAWAHRVSRLISLCTGGLEFEGLGSCLVRGTRRPPSWCLDPGPVAGPHTLSQRICLAFKFFVFDCFAFQLEIVNSGEGCSFGLSFKRPSCWENLNEVLGISLLLLSSDAAARGSVLELLSTFLPACPQISSVRFSNWEEIV